MAVADRRNASAATSKALPWQRLQGRPQGTPLRGTGHRSRLPATFAHGSGAAWQNAACKTRLLLLGPPHGPGKVAASRHPHEGPVQELLRVTAQPGGRLPCPRHRLLLCPLALVVHGLDRECAGRISRRACRDLCTVPHQHSDRAPLLAQLKMFLPCGATPAADGTTVHGFRPVPHLLPGSFSPARRAEQLERP